MNEVVPPIEEAQAAGSETILRLPVAELVTFACRSGDLVSDTPGGPSAQEGIRAHQHLQKRRPPGSEAEYKLEVQWQTDNQTVILSGRVDILHPKTDLHRPVQLDEIKTTYCPPEQIPESTRQLQWAQLKIYGFCYLLSRRTEKGQHCADGEEIVLQLVWYNLKEKKSYSEMREFHWPELEAFARTAVGNYLSWNKRWQQYREQVRASARRLKFPFPDFRPGQRQLAVAVFRCLRDSGELVAEAPTGIGKTVSTLFPAIKALGDGAVDQLVYLTAKNSGRHVVRETAERLHRQGLTLSVLEIQARDKTCACRVGLCSPDPDGICPRTRGFFDRLPEARRLLLGNPFLTPERIAQVADDLQLCPFELSLQMVPWVDLVVCDFNYVFDPLIRLGALCRPDRRSALLVDEAHNLIDRARAMYSAALTRSETLRAAAACTGRHRRLGRRIQNVARQLDRWVEQQRESQAESNGGNQLWVTHWSDTGARPVALTSAARKLIDDAFSNRQESELLPEAMETWLKNLHRFLGIEALATHAHRCLTQLKRNSARWQDRELQLLCLNAADYLRPIYRAFHAVVFFSATLRPATYIYHQLGLRGDSPYLQLASPFRPEQLGVYICPYVDTRYKSRHNAMDLLVDLVIRVYRSRPGNYLVFFPSYQFLQQVAQRFMERYPHIALLRQNPADGEQERAAFLGRFSEGHRSLGFAIMGGVFGEGVDYVGESLVGTIVVGVGLPQVTPERELLRRDCDEDEGTPSGSGFDFAYRYPGMTRVLQTAGRVIRTDSDRGVLILADNRFTQPFYRTLYPAHWRLQRCGSGEDLSRELDRFWKME